VQRADQILLLEDGEIAGQGTHETLLNSSALYRQVYELQIQPESGEFA
jgi:ABC-type multidrug transport system fused ATPase/permease subunit